MRISPLVNRYKEATKKQKIWFWFAILAAWWVLSPLWTTSGGSGSGGSSSYYATSYNAGWNDVARQNDMNVDCLSDYQMSNLFSYGQYDKANFIQGCNDALAALQNQIDNGRTSGIQQR
jgi:hypothetical protein